MINKAVVFFRRPFVAVPMIGVEWESLPWAGSEKCSAKKT